MMQAHPSPKHNGGIPFGIVKRHLGEVAYGSAKD